MAVRFICCISTVDVVSDLVPTGFPCSDFSRRACVTIVLLVVGKICARIRLSALGRMTFLVGNAQIAGAKMAIRNLGIQLLAHTLPPVPFAMVMTVGTEALAFKVICRQTASLHGGVSALYHRRHMPIILAVAKRFGMDDDLMCRIYEGLAVVPLHNPMGGRQFRRVISGDRTLQLFAPLAPLRFARRSKVLEARRLFL